MFNKLERMIIWGSIFGCLLAPMIVHAQETTVGPPASAAPTLKPDPSGANTGGAADVVGATAGAPTAEEMKKWATNEPLAMKLADVVGHNRIAINIVWTLLCGFLVFFMQAGFALVAVSYTHLTLPTTPYV